MKKNNKIALAIILVLLMLVFTACSGDYELKQPTNNESGEKSETTVAIVETVLYDANDIKITATKLEKGFLGPEVKVLVENNSSKNILATVDSVSVNGYMMSAASLYAEVAAGKKANEEISFMSSELEQAGIETIAKMQFYISISDAETWGDIAKSELLVLNTSAVDYVQPVDDSGDELYAANGIKVVCKGLKKDVFWDGVLVFYIENNSGKAVTAYAENVSVNGFMVDASMWSDLRDGTKIVDGLSLLDISELEIEGIEEIENIEFNLRFINSETWDEIATTDAIELNFK
ncbi:MAG: hypothetical protein J6Q54_02095 [Oscillospiraceae bacterium]|nr:hypothetical protein [Oscillospiraceae bacterium]